MTETSRPAIPTDLKRRVLVEAGHRCAIPSCRYITTELHHIIPWSECQTHEYDNLIALCPNCHSRADSGEIDKKSLRMYKNNLRFVIEKYSQFEMDVLFELVNGGVKHLPFPSYFKLLIKRILDSGFVSIKIIDGGMYLGDIKTTPDLLILTSAGKTFVESLSNEDIGYDR